MNAKNSVSKSLRVVGLAVALPCCLIVGLASEDDSKTGPKAAVAESAASSERLTSRPCPAPPPVATLRPGEEAKTEAGQRRRLVLDGGIVLYLNENTHVKHSAENDIELVGGEIHVEVTRTSKGKHDVVTWIKSGKLKVHGYDGHWNIRTEAKGHTVNVLRGGAGACADGVNTHIIRAGENWLSTNPQARTLLPRASHIVEWTKDLIAAAASPLVPGSQHAGGKLLAVDPNGQEAKITLRKFHVDVHIEDGFARTTIDQTYFNNEAIQLEGTFYFPLPPDASLSRLAMYVDGNLMEGGMAERDYARQVYETIRYANRDPALLEWVDGSTFKMRVFPLEPRQEKRIILSYTQRIPSLYGQSQYRFPAGHSMQKVESWSFNARVKNGAETVWTSPSHPAGTPAGLRSRLDGNDLVLAARAKNTPTDRDVILELSEKAKTDEAVHFAATTHEGSQYMMLRYRPRLQIRNPQSEIKNRLWLFLFESSGDRDPLLGRAQIEVIKNFLTHVERNDKFLVATAGTRVRFHSAKPQPATEGNIKAAVEFLDNTHLIGALDLAGALEEVKKRIPADQNVSLVHVGTGVPAMGERRDAELVRRLPDGIRYVGVGVGRRWNRSFMKAAAESSGGHFTQINPDEPIAWRAFDLFATLNTPRLMNIEIEADDGVTEALGMTLMTSKPRFHVFNQSIAQGEEICAITRCGPVLGYEKEKRQHAFELPKNVRVTGTLEGKQVEYRLKTANVRERADYLPRTWAKLEIDRLLADWSLGTHTKATVINLSKAMYVMTPFTSLLVLEHEDLYTQYKVDKGRKDHWAMYDCPPKIPVVYEPEPGQIDPKKLKEKQHAKAIASTVLTRAPLRFIGAIEYGRPQRISSESEALLDVFGRPAPMFDAQPEAKAPPAPPSRIKLPGVIYSLGGGEAKQAKKLPPQLEFFSPRLANPTGLKKIEEIAKHLDGAIANQKVFSDEMPITGSIFGRSGESKEDPFVTTDLDPRDREFDADMPRLELARRIRKQGLGLDAIPISRGANPEPAADPQFQFATTFFRDDSPVANSLIYRRPSYVGNERIFYDLVAYAPGMNTKRADLEAVLEAEALPTAASKVGQVDASARALIDKARAADWQTLTLPAEGIRPGFSITFDGTGRYAYERVLPPGIKERVFCDGTTLVHLYPQLFVGARREVSRFHRADFASAVPWFVPSADDLARGADLKIVDDRVVAIVPHYEATLVQINMKLKEAFEKSEKEGKTPRGKDKTEAPQIEWARINLVFTKDGRLAERQLVYLPKNEIAYRQIIQAEGTVRLVDAKGKELAVQKGKLAPAQAPHMQSSFGELVVLPLPYRTASHVQRTLKITDKRLEDLRLAEALPLFAAYIGSNHGADAQSVFQRCFANRDQRQLGFYVLLAACGVNLDAQHLNVLGEHLDEPLAQYLALHTSPVLRKHAAQWAVNSASWGEGFLQHLANTHALFQRWQSDKIVRGDPARFKTERNRAFDYVKKHKDSVFGWSLLCLMEDRAAETKVPVANPNPSPAVRQPEYTVDHDFYRELAEAFRLFDDIPSLGYAARYEHARCLYKAGETKDARKRFHDLYAQTLKDDVLPAIDSDFRQAMLGSGKSEPDWWSEQLQRTARKLIEQRRRPAILALAWQCWQLNDQPLAKSLFATALDKIDDAREKTAMTMAGIQFLWQTSQVPHADELFAQLAADKELAKEPGLWRLGVKLADHRDMTARSLESLEKALEGEYQKLPPVIDLQTVRADYGRLLGHYDKLAESMVTLKVRPGPDFLAKVVRAADRWRALDRESSEPSTYAARILQRLGDRELSWDYLTTPIAMKPNEAGPWLTLAGNLARKGDLELADRSFKSAFETEPTNAQILWDRAENLRRLGKNLEARDLFRQIAEGAWQPRFQGLVNQARTQVGN